MNEGELIKVTPQAQSQTVKPEEQGFYEGAHVYRNGRPCTIVKVERDVDPPSYIVRMDDGLEVNTERERLSLHPPRPTGVTPGLRELSDDIQNARRSSRSARTSDPVQRNRDKAAQLERIQQMRANLQQEESILNQEESILEDMNK